MTGVYVCDSMYKTEKAAAQLANEMKGGEVIAFKGGLGSGKTAFCSAFAKALGCTEIVTSPTFVIMNRYCGRFIVNHFDMYRIRDFDSLYSIGFFDAAASPDSVTLVEWSENVADWMGTPDYVIEASAEGDVHTFSIRRGDEK